MQRAFEATQGGGRGKGEERDGRGVSWVGMPGRLCAGGGHVSMGSAYEWPGWGRISGSQGDGGWGWAAALGIQGKAHRARNKTQES